MYYLRTRPVTKAQQFTIEPEKRDSKTGSTEDGINGSKSPSSPIEKEKKAREEEKRAVAMVCDRSNPDCEACSA